MKKLNAVEAKDLHIGCLNCSTAALKAPMDMMIAVGFGSAIVFKDGKMIYDGEADCHKTGKAKTVKHFEMLARKSPKSDWRIQKYGPMHGETFQRQGKNNWVCVESNQGFA
jgi:hypothetical protein